MLYLFIRQDGFYPLELEIPADLTEKEVILEHVLLNKGTLRVENSKTGEVIYDSNKGDESPLDSLAPRPLNKEELWRARMKSSEWARENLTAQEAHKRMRENGAVPKPNRFYTGKISEEECWRRLNEE